MLKEKKDARLSHIRRQIARTKSKLKKLETEEARIQAIEVTVPEKPEKGKKKK